MMCIADLKIWMRKEYNPCALFWVIVIISSSISEGEMGLKKKEPGAFTWGRDSENCLNGFGILEAKFYLTKEKYLFIISGNSEAL